MRNSFAPVLLFLVLLYPQVSGAQDCILKNAHAHNDYKHKHPLEDALKNKFASVEADIFTIDDKLVVSHTHPFLKKKKTLEELYLKSLLDSCTKNNGNVYRECDAPFILLIDIKSDAEKTYALLNELLITYLPILTRCEDGKLIPNAVTVVLSGNKPYEAVKKDKLRYAFIDQNLLEMDNDTGPDLYPMASTKYSNILTWKGKGELPKAEKEKLIALVTQAHGQGKKVRLWASPENKKVWNELLNCGVDLINTDKLEELNAFLKERK